MIFLFPSVICTLCTGFFCLAIIKGPPNDIYFIIEGPYDGYFTEKVSQARFKDVDGNWYYLNPVSDGTQGAMKTGWFTDPQDGYLYYLDPKTGAMVTGNIQNDSV
ncbi:MAG: hypothetical protein SOZ61_11660 [Candidatus Copromonas sp.]|nr:hypothetical protein [Candidatus Copromonas sp.]